MNTIMGQAWGEFQMFHFKTKHLYWNVSPQFYFNPRYYFRSVGWYLNFYDRIKAEPSYWREKNPPEASYVRHMKDAGRGHLL